MAKYEYELTTVREIVFLLKNNHLPHEYRHIPYHHVDVPPLDVPYHRVDVHPPMLCSLTEVN